MRSSEIRQLVKKLRRMGYTVTQMKSGHWKIDTPNGTVTFSHSPSDWHAIDNIMADLRRNGVPV